MDRSRQQADIIDMDEDGSRRLGVVTTIIIVLSVALIIVPYAISNDTQPAETPGVARPAGQAVPSALCRLTFDVPPMLDPVAQIVLPGWTLICDLLSRPSFPEPFDPEG